MFGRKRLACSFCGRGEADVAKLVAGPKVYICDRCVALAGQIMAGRSGDELQASEFRPTFLQRVLSRVGRAREPRRTRPSERVMASLTR